jgi:hypothetical protein
MARLADYFIVVGYDHEKPGKGVGRAPPPGLLRLRPPPLSSGLGGAGRRGLEAGRRGPGRAGRLRSVLPASGLLGGAEPRGGREGPARPGLGLRPRRPGPGRTGWASLEPVPEPRPCLPRWPGIRGSALVLAGLGPGPQGWEGGSQLCKFLGDKLLPCIPSE